MRLNRFVLWSETNCAAVVRISEAFIIKSFLLQNMHELQHCRVINKNFSVKTDVYGNPKWLFGLNYWSWRNPKEKMITCCVACRVCLIILSFRTKFKKRKVLIRHPIFARHINYKNENFKWVNKCFLKTVTKTAKLPTSWIKKNDLSIFEKVTGQKYRMASVSKPFQAPSNFLAIAYDTIRSTV